MNLLALFGKHWQPGAVKTRLAARWGDDVASRLYRAFLENLLLRLGNVADERWLVYTPAGARTAFMELAGDGWQLREQATGDLGKRMATLFAEAFAAGALRVVLIGSDSPNLPVSRIEQAFALLEQNAVVICPADDGGYCLLGARDNVPPIFENIAWSTDQVFMQSTARLCSARVPFTNLEPWYDIDMPADLERLYRDLRTETDANLTQLRAEIESALPLSSWTAPPLIRANSSD